MQASRQKLNLRCSAAGAAHDGARECGFAWSASNLCTTELALRVSTNSLRLNSAKQAELWARWRLSYKQFEALRSRPPAHLCGLESEPIPRPCPVDLAFAGPLAKAGAPAPPWRPTLAPTEEAHATRPPQLQLREHHNQTGLSNGLGKATLTRSLGQVAQLSLTTTTRASIALQYVTGTSHIRRATRTTSQVSTSRAVTLPEFPSG